VTRVKKKSCARLLAFCGFTKKDTNRLSLSMSESNITNRRDMPFCDYCDYVWDPENPRNSQSSMSFCHEVNACACCVRANDENDQELEREDGEWLNSFDSLPDRVKTILVKEMADSKKAEWDRKRAVADAQYKLDNPTVSEEAIAANPLQAVAQSVPVLPPPAAGGSKKPKLPWRRETDKDTLLLKENLIDLVTFYSVHSIIMTTDERAITWTRITNDFFLTETAKKYNAVSTYT
jgi:hypothetical protein